MTQEVDPEASEQFAQEVIEGAQDAPSADGAMNDDHKAIVNIFLLQ